MNQLIGIKGGDNEKERSNDKEYTRKMIEHDEMGEGGKKKRRERENFRSSFETKETPSYLIPSHLSLPPVSALFPSLPPSPPPPSACRYFLRIAVYSRFNYERINGLIASHSSL